MKRKIFEKLKTFPHRCGKTQKYTEIQRVVDAELAAEQKRTNISFESGADRWALTE